MKQTKSLVLAGATLLLLTGCSAPSVEELKEDRALLESTMEKCSEMDASKAREDEGCQNATTAYQQLAMEGLGNLLKGMGR